MSSAGSSSQASSMAGGGRSSNLIAKLQLFPLLKAFELRLPSKVVKTGLLIELLQPLGFAINPHLRGHSISWNIIYFLLLPFWDGTYLKLQFEYFLPFFWLVAVAVLFVAGVCASGMRAGSEHISDVLLHACKLIVHLFSTVFFIPAVMTMLTSTSCVKPDAGGNDVVWLYQETKCLSDAVHALHFAVGIVCVAMLSVIAYLVYTSLFDDAFVSLHVNARSHTLVDKLAFVYRLGLCVSFHVLLSRGMVSVYAFIVCAASLSMAVAQIFFVPYYKETTNKLKTLSYVTTAWCALLAFIDAKMTDEFLQTHYIVLGATYPAVAFIAWKLALVRRSNTMQQLIKLARDEGEIPSELNPFVYASLRNNSDLLPFPHGLPTSDRLISPLASLDVDIVTEFIRSEEEQAQNGDDELTDEEIAEKQRQRLQVVCPYVDRVYTATDAELACRTLNSWRLATMINPTPHMLGFCCRIYAKAMVRFTESPMLFLHFIGFLSVYVPSISRLNLCLQVLEKISGMEASAMEMYVTFRQSLRLKQVLGIRDKTHQGTYMHARRLHKEILVQMASMWRNLLHPNCRLISLAVLANSITQRRERGLDSYKRALLHSSGDELMLKNFALFLDQIIVHPEASELCRDLAEETAEERRARLLQRGQRSDRMSMLSAATSSAGENDTMRLEEIFGSVDEQTARFTSNNTIRVLSLSMTLVFLLLGSIVIANFAMGIATTLQQQTVIARIESAGRARTLTQSITATVAQLTYRVETDGVGAEDGVTDPDVLALIDKLRSQGREFQSHHNYLTFGEGTTKDKEHIDFYTSSFSPRYVYETNTSVAMALSGLWVIGNEFAAAVEQIVSLTPAVIPHDKHTKYILANGPTRLADAYDRSIALYQKGSQRMTATSELGLALLFGFSVVITFLVYLLFIWNFKKIAGSKASTLGLFKLIPRDTLQTMASEGRDRIEHLVAGEEDKNDTASRLSLVEDEGVADVRAENLSQTGPSPAPVLSVESEDHEEGEEGNEKPSETEEGKAELQEKQHVVDLQSKTSHSFISDVLRKGSVVASSLLSKKMSDGESGLSGWVQRAKNNVKGTPGDTAISPEESSEEKKRKRKQKKEKAQQEETERFESQFAEMMDEEDTRIKPVMGGRRADDTVPLSFLALVFLCVALAGAGVGMCYFGFSSLQALEGLEADHEVLSDQTSVLLDAFWTRDRMLRRFVNEEWFSDIQFLEDARAELHAKFDKLVSSDLLTEFYLINDDLDELVKMGDVAMRLVVDTKTNLKPDDLEYLLSVKWKADDIDKRTEFARFMGEDVTNWVPYTNTSHDTSLRQPQRIALAKQILYGTRYTALRRHAIKEYNTIVPIIVKVDSASLDRGASTITLGLSVGIGLLALCSLTAIAVYISSGDHKSLSQSLTTLRVAAVATVILAITTIVLCGTTIDEMSVWASFAHAQQDVVDEGTLIKGEIYFQSARVASYVVHDNLLALDEYLKNSKDLTSENLENALIDTGVVDMEEDDKKELNLHREDGALLRSIEITAIALKASVTRDSWVLDTMAITNHRWALQLEHDFLRHSLEFDDLPQGYRDSTVDLQEDDHRRLSRAEHTITGRRYEDILTKTVASLEKAVDHIEHKIHNEQQGVKNLSETLLLAAIGLSCACLVLTVIQLLVVVNGLLNVYADDNQKVIYDKLFRQQSRKCLLGLTFVVLLLLVLFLVSFTTVGKVERGISSGLFASEKAFLVSRAAALAELSVIAEDGHVRDYNKKLLRSVIIQAKSVRDKLYFTPDFIPIRDAQNADLYGSEATTTQFDPAVIQDIDNSGSCALEVDFPAEMQFIRIIRMLESVAYTNNVTSAKAATLLAQTYLDAVAERTSESFVAYEKALMSEIDTNIILYIIVLVVILLCVFFVYALVFRPIVSRLAGEEHGTKLLLMMIPESVRNNVNEIAEYFNNDDVDSDELRMKKSLQQSENLLQNILPPVISRRLKSGESPIADDHPVVTVVFATLCGFDEVSKSMNQPADIVNFLNQLICTFDHIVDLLELEKIKTIGETYFLCGGLSKKTEKDHDLRCMEVAMLFEEALKEHAVRYDAQSILQLRTGVNTGPAVAGVIGSKKVAYDLWGDSVNTASRMQSTGLPGKIQCSQSTYDRVNSYFTFKEREIFAKGKGKLKVYTVSDRKAPTPFTGKINWRRSR